MRNIRLRQLLPLNREKGAATAILCQQKYSTRSVDSTNPTHDYASIAVGIPYSAPSSTANKHPTLPNPEPILLLEGDNYRFSADGIARSLYQLRSESNINRNLGDPEFFGGLSQIAPAIEEIYDIGRARKGFVIRNVGGVRLGDASPPISFVLQEISPEIEQNGAGTGSRTWESSIAMASYFASHPEYLNGNVIEIGSGVGLGGILSFLFRSLSVSTTPFRSITLSDCNPKVLDCCNENVQSFLKSFPSISSISVEELDWYDILQRTRKSLKHSEQYDTVIACDCAYDYTDIAALIGTLKGLLRKKKTSKAHIFGPTSRGGLRKLISELKQDPSLQVDVECIEMERYRLDPPHTKEGVQSLDDVRTIVSSSSISNDNESQLHSKFNSEFLHVTCSFCLDTDVMIRNKVQMDDID